MQHERKNTLSDRNIYYVCVDIYLWINNGVMDFNMKEPLILDACCGARMMWFNKEHPDALYIDIRREDPGFIKSKRFREIDPDIEMDFRDLKFYDQTFSLVLFDPPHRSDLGKTSIMYKNYGNLNNETWPYDLKQGFRECWRVLKDYGILIFKWNEKQIKKQKVLDLFPVKPLFGHPTNSKNTTWWFCFMKIPDEGGKK